MNKGRKPEGKNWILVLGVMLFCVLLFGRSAPAKADYGYTSVSMIPEAVDFSYQLNFDAEGNPSVSVDYPFAQKHANELLVYYRDQEGNFLFELEFKYESGEIRMNPEEIAEHSAEIQNGTAVVDEIMLGWVDADERAGWVLVRSGNRFLAYMYIDQTAAGETVRAVFYDEDGTISGSMITVSDGNTGNHLYLEFDRYGRLNGGRVESPSDDYLYDPETGLFGGQPVTAYGFDASLLDLQPAAALDMPPQSDLIAESLSGAKDLTVKVNKTIRVRKSDFRLDPAGSLINGRGSYREAEFELWGYNNIFNGRSETETVETTGGDVVISITPNTPGYYPIFAYVTYYDPVEDQEFQVDSDFFMLTVLDENGKKPAPDPLAVELFSIPSATVGETVQINWRVSGAYRPFTDTVRIYKGTDLIAEWCYEETEIDTFVFEETGTYRIQILCTDALSRTALDDMVIEVTPQKSLVLKELTLRQEKNPNTGERIPGSIRWELDYEGGYGTKTTVVHLINEMTGEDRILYDYGFFPSFSQNEIEDGIYYIRMNVKDDEGDHWIESNKLTLLNMEQPEWELVLPADVRVIEKEAFKGITAEAVRINDGCSVIGESAFADSSVNAVYIPDTVTEIGPDAIPEGAKVFTTENSWAARNLDAEHYLIIPVD